MPPFYVTPLLADGWDGGITAWLTAVELRHLRVACTCECTQLQAQLNTLFSFSLPLSPCLPHCHPSAALCCSCLPHTAQRNDTKNRWKIVTKMYYGLSL